MTAAMIVADASARSLPDLISLAGRRAVATGGAQGLGRAIVRRLVEAGSAVLIGDLNLDQAQATADELRSAIRRHGAGDPPRRHRDGLGRVLGVAPAFCETEGNAAALALLPERVRTEIAATLTSMLGRVGVPDDIARAVLFCASDMALFMTGSTLLVDAGETA